MLGCETYGHLGCLLCLPCSISDLGVFQNQRQLESFISNGESCLGIVPPSSGRRDLLGPITLPAVPNTPWILIWCSWPRGSACSPLCILSAEPSILQMLLMLALYCSSLVGSACVAIYFCFLLFLWAEESTLFSLITAGC